MVRSRTLPQLNEAHITLNPFFANLQIKDCLDSEK